MPKAALPAPAGILYIIVVCLRSGVSREMLMLMLMLCTENAFEFIEMGNIKLNDRVAAVPLHMKKKIFTVL